MEEPRGIIDMAKKHVCKATVSIEQHYVVRTLSKDEIRRDVQTIEFEYACQVDFEYSRMCKLVSDLYPNAYIIDHDIEVI